MFSTEKKKWQNVKQSCLHCFGNGSYKWAVKACDWRETGLHLAFVSVSSSFSQSIFENWHLEALYKWIHHGIGFNRPLHWLRWSLETEPFSEAQLQAGRVGEEGKQKREMYVTLKAYDQLISVVQPFSTPINAYWSVQREPVAVRDLR